MKKKENKRTSILRSLIALVTMAAVLAISLPAFKMDVEAAGGRTFYYDVYDFPPNAFDYLIALEGGEGQGITGFAMAQPSGDSFETVGYSGTLSEGSRIMVPANFQEYGATFDMSILQANSDWGEVVSVNPKQGESGDPLDIRVFTLTTALSYNISGTTISITLLSSDSGSATASSPASQPAAGSGNLSNLIAQLKAWQEAQQQKIRAGQEAAKIRKDQQAQLDRDNLYFRNLNEAIRNGKSMVVFSDHSALRSQVNGTYLANSVPGFAALFMGLPNPNLHIETWNITSKNAPDAVNAINGVAEQNGYTVGAMLQVNIGEKGSDGKPVYESTNKEPVANIVMGVPNSIRGDGAEYGAVQVLPGGEIHMYKDLPFNDNAVSLPLGIGRSAIGLVQTK